MKKITVAICTGTACYVMGGSELLLLEDALPPELAEHVTIEGRTCVELCKRGGPGASSAAKANQSKPPYVLVDDEVVEEATVQTVIAKIEEKYAASLEANG